MPRRKGPPDAMTSTYGNKSEHIRIRITAHELDLMTRALTHGGYESQSQFLRAALVMLAEQTLGGPTAVERRILAQQEYEEATPVMTQPVAAPLPEPVEQYTPEAPSLQFLLNLGEQKVAAAPMEAPLDFDEGGWVG